MESEDDIYEVDAEFDFEAHAKALFLIVRGLGDAQHKLQGGMSNFGPSVGERTGLTAAQLLTCVDICESKGYGQAFVVENSHTRNLAPFPDIQYRNYTLAQARADVADHFGLEYSEPSDNLPATDDAL
jgi:hypothetical protein